MLGFSQSEERGEGRERGEKGRGEVKKEEGEKGRGVGEKEEGEKGRGREEGKGRGLGHTGKCY